jgi:hypothetical protein
MSQHKNKERILGTTGRSRQGYSIQALSIECSLTLLPLCAMLEHHDVEKINETGFDRPQL